MEDIASLAGIILGAVMFVFGVFSNGGFEALKNMVDPASIIITVGGSISGVLAAHKLPDFINGLKGITLTFKEKKIRQRRSKRSLISRMWQEKKACSH